jgi:hypothetical protein
MTIVEVVGGQAGSLNLNFFFRSTPDGSRQVVYQAGKTIAFCKFTELMQWQRSRLVESLTKSENSV